MYIFNFKEFKENRLPIDTTLDDYIVYLENTKNEIEELMSTEEKDDVNRLFSSQLEYYLKFIDNILEIINGSKKTIIMQSIDRLSFQDLQSLYGNMIDEYTSELDKLNLKLTEIDQRIEVEINECHKRFLDLKANYEKEDTELFFEQPTTAFLYLSKLIKMDEINEEELRQNINYVIQFENNKYKINSSDNGIQCMVDGLLTLIKNCRDIYKKYPDKLDYIVNSLLADKNIGKVLDLYYHENIIDELCIDMQNIFKEKTAFFQGLPKDIQTSLRSENFNGPCYEELYTYQSILSGNLDNNSFKSVKLDSLKEERLQIEKDISLLEDKIKEEKDLIQNDELLKNYLKSQVVVDEDNLPSYLDVNNYIDKLQEMKTIDKQIADNNECINRLEEILMSVPFYSEEQEVDSSQMEMEVDMQFYLDVEEARFDQINIMIEAERALEELERKIKSLKASKFKSVLSKSCRQLISEYQKQYDYTVIDTYEKLDDQKILVVEAPDKLNHHFINEEPKSFDDLVYVKQIFWNLANYMEEILAYGLATKNDAYKLITIQKHCVNKLFSYSKDEDGFYRFNISDEERNILLQCQESIVYLARALIEKRNSIEQDDFSSIDESIIEELKNMGLESFNKDDLLMATYSLSRENEKLSNTKRVIEENIQDGLLSIISSMNDAINYRDMLTGFDDCRVPIDEIKHSLQVKK